MPEQLRQAERLTLQAGKTAQVVKQRVDHYLELSRRVLSHHDPDTIHDFRVASRNLLVTAPLISGHHRPSWQREVKTWLKALNRLRDLQVLGERLQGHGRVSLILNKRVEHELQQWKQEHHQVVSKQFRHQLKDECRQAARRIRKSPEQFEPVLRQQYEAIREKLAERLDEADTAEAKTLHRLRIAYKSFRYMVALLHDAGILPDLNWEELKQWQDILGAIQDDEVASAWLLENRPQDEELIRSIQFHSEQLRQQFHAELPRFRKFVTALFEASESSLLSTRSMQ